MNFTVPRKTRNDVTRDKIACLGRKSTICTDTFPINPKNQRSYKSHSKSDSKSASLKLALKISELKNCTQKSTKIKRAKK